MNNEQQEVSTWTDTMLQNDVEVILTEHGLKRHFTYVQELKARVAELEAENERLGKDIQMLDGISLGKSDIVKQLEADLKAYEKELDKAGEAYLESQTHIQQLEGALRKTIDSIICDELPTTEYAEAALPPKGDKSDG